MATYNVSVKHDPATRVYYIEDSDIPGLHAESASADELFEIVHDLAADLVPKEDLAEASIQFHGLPARQALTPLARLQRSTVGAPAISFAATPFSRSSSHLWRRHLHGRRCLALSPVEKTDVKSLP